jgi:hypothetical protein
MVASRATAPRDLATARSSGLGDRTGGDGAGALPIPDAVGLGWRASRRGARREIAPLKSGWSLSAFEAAEGGGRIKWQSRHHLRRRHTHMADEIGSPRVADGLRSEPQRLQAGGQFLSSTIVDQPTSRMSSTAFIKASAALDKTTGAFARSAAPRPAETPVRDPREVR